MVFTRLDKIMNAKHNAQMPGQIMTPIISLAASDMVLKVNLMQTPEAIVR